MENPEQAILGTGWSFPPTFSRMTLGVDMVSAAQDIRESLWILFSTSLGERVMLPQYGTRIWQMVFRAINTTLKTQLEEMVRQAILYWEPRIDVLEVNVSATATAEGRVDISVDYL